jgi:hypothetical protein
MLANSVHTQSGAALHGFSPFRRWSNSQRKKLAEEEDMHQHSPRQHSQNFLDFCRHFGKHDPCDRTSIKASQ